MSTPRFIGLDLAWSERNTTGAVVLKPEAGPQAGGRARLVACHSAVVRDDREILDYVERHAAAGPVILGIDAPIIAPNPPGTSRLADREVSRLYAKYQAGVYPANRERCARPIALAKKLAQRGYSLDPTEAPGSGGKFAVEVYPHAAAVGLFGLKQIVKYKKGRVAARRRGLGEWQRLLGRQLPTLDPAMESLPAEDPEPLRGRALKALEDRLDAVMCAAMVAVHYVHPERCLIVGDRDSGYILVPKPP